MKNNVIQTKLFNALELREKKASRLNSFENNL